MSAFRRCFKETDPRTKRWRPCRRRLTVEALEDRLTPAIIAVTTPVDVVAADDGKVSLREAINLANARTGRDIITLPAGLYQVRLAGAGEDGNARGDFDITGPVAIQGAGAPSTFIDAATLDRVFDLLGDFNVTFSGVTIRNGFAPDLSGGGIQSREAVLTLNHSIVRGNTSFEGGGIYAGSSVRLNHSKVTDNEAAGLDGDGGGIAATVGLVSLRNSTVSGNVARRNGGGINTPTARVDLVNSVIKGNFAGAEGGGIKTNTGPVILTHSTISRNVAGTDGGGIDVDIGGIGPDAGFVMLTGSTVSDNVAAGSGGGISCFDITLDHSSVSGNASAGRGGGIFVDDGAQGGLGDIMLTASSVTQNTARLDGGGIYHSFNLGTVIIEGSTISGNVASATTADGGGLFVDKVLLQLTDSTLRDNRTGRRGGGMWSGGETSLFKVTVSDNTAGLGGGVYMEGNLTLEQSLVEGNRALAGGGGVCLNSGVSRLTNVTLSGNTAAGFGLGGGLFNNASVSLLNVTVTRNAAVAGGGIFNNATIGVRNSLIAQNQVSGGPALGPDVSGSFNSQGRNLIGITDGSSGWITGIVIGVSPDLVGDSTNPLDPKLGPLADNGGPTLTHALLTGSPAIDQCVFLVDVIPATDQRGEVRGRDGDGDGVGLRGDIGAFEK